MLAYNQYNEDGQFINVEDSIAGDDYDEETFKVVVTGDENIIEVEIEEGIITVTAPDSDAKIGNATIKIMEGGLERASYAVEVIDTTPVTTSISLAKGVEAIELEQEASEVEFKDLGDYFVVLDQYGEEMDAEDVDDVVFFSSDEDVFKVEDGTKISAADSVETGAEATLIVKLNKDVLEIPVIIVETE